jgi:hypothetical protein
MEMNEAEERVKEVPGGIQDQEKPEPEKPQWGNFKTTETYQGEPDPTLDEDTLEYFARNITANASRIGEQAVGRYGNTEKVGKSILTEHPWAGGVVGAALAELLGPEKWETFVKGEKGQQQMLPTSEDLKELSQKTSGGYTKPKNKGEEKFQEYTEAIGSTLRPTIGATARNVALNNFVTPAASTAVEQIVEGLGFGKDKATKAKIATWMALSLATNINAPQYASNLMNQGRNIPAGIQANVPRIQAGLQRVRQDPNFLHADPRTELARQQIARIEEDLANGQTSIRSMMTSYDGVNAVKRNKDMFSMTRSDQRFATSALNNVRDVIRTEIDATAAQFPEQINAWQSGVQAWAVIHQSRALTNYVENLARGPYQKLLAGPTLGLFGIGAYGAKAAPYVSLTGTAATTAAYKSGQLGYRMLYDENLRNYYFQALGAAANRDTPAFIKNYLKIEKQIEKSESVKKKTKSKKH